MKILVLTNKLKYDLQDDFQKTFDFFKTRLPFPFQVVFQEVDIPTAIKEYKTINGFDSITGKPTIVSYMGLQDSVKDNCRNFVKEGECDIAIFAYDMDKFVLPSNQSLTSWTNFLSLYKGTEFIQLSINSYLDTQGLLWQRISHEMMHALCYKLSRNFNKDGLDEMDITRDGKPFYKNSDPYVLDGNYALTLKNITPYLSLLTNTKPTQLSPHFKLQEFVSKDIFAQYGEKSIWYIDPRLVTLAEFVRNFFNKSITINNGVDLNYRGFREPECSVGAKLSQHRFGRAMDINVSGMTAKQVYDTILANEEAFMKAGLTCMEDISSTPTWCHLDLRQTNLPHILIVQP